MILKYLKRVNTRKEEYLTSKLRSYRVLFLYCLVKHIFFIQRFNLKIKFFQSHSFIISFFLSSIERPSNTKTYRAMTFKCTVISVNRNCCNVTTKNQNQKFCSCLLVNKINILETGVFRDRFC